jgi:hypothetical protein
MPPGVAAPLSVDTHLATVKFNYGYPNKATTELLWDNLDFQRAVQAYLLVLPTVTTAPEGHIWTTTSCRLAARC